MHLPQTEEELDLALSQPGAEVLEALRPLGGDFILLGAGGKMGPTLAWMIRRGLDALGRQTDRVLAVSRFSDRRAAQWLEQRGIATLSADLLDPAAVAALPQAAQVLYLAGQKFGTSQTPSLTWAMNTLAPAAVAQHFAQARTLIYSTGCVYPLVAAGGPGSCEQDALTPPGEYANACVGRERIFEHFGRRLATPQCFFRLCYAVELRYGVLHDLAQRILQDQPVDLSMGEVQVIWQHDAHLRALQCLSLCAQPGPAINITGPQRLRVRDLALELGRRLGRRPRFENQEGPLSWAWDTQRSLAHFGAPPTPLEFMLDATAQWVAAGGRSLGKPTHFEVNDGQF